MTPKAARTRYFKVFVPAMAGYVGSMFLAAAILDKEAPPSVLAVILALIPALCIMVWMWGQARFISEIDEFQRKVQIDALLAGLAMTLAICTGWGLLEMFANVPALPIFNVIVIFAFCYGPASIVISRRRGADCVGL
ncbi:hypothetical protein [Fretibacter rubidus]|uniref:hypothetical protein n=1 Tax=Fretibacter rubidus TaxID=570162 RepID=UPI00352B2FC6